jgi:hypothetical protein
MAIDATAFSTVAPGYARLRGRSLLAGLLARVISTRIAQARHRQRFHLAELPEAALMLRRQAPAAAEEQA